VAAVNAPAAPSGWSLVTMKMYLQCKQTYMIVDAVSLVVAVSAPRHLGQVDSAVKWRHLTRLPRSEFGDRSRSALSDEWGIAQLNEIDS
jgi:hypothetical protein